MKSFLRKTIFYRLYKKSLANLALLINWNPWKDMFLVWITWTDWKSTTSNLVHKIFNDNLWKTALVTTISIKIWDSELENNSKMTSLSPFQLQKILSEAKSAWCKYVVLEVSSHWIDQFRFHWLEFDLWVLTNITPEHLDYHWTFENYAETKKKLFKWILLSSKENKYAVFPKDDKVWRQWYDEIWFDYSIDFWILTNASLKTENIEQKPDGLDFSIKYLWQTYTWSSNLIWKFNLYNILAATSVWILLWIKIDDVLDSIWRFPALPWRMEYINLDNKNFYIDFAHTPNSLKSVLSFINEIKWDNKIITVFWAPWNRDKFKRPKMWEVVSMNSDFVILTDDDPDSENRFSILNDVNSWVKRKLWDNYYVIPSRANAIKLATELAKDGDFVLLAGKWHENVQVTNFGKKKWNDKKFLKSLYN